MNAMMVMRKKKETKGTCVYEPIGDDVSPVGSLYVSKLALTKPYPEFLKFTVSSDVTIEDVTSPEGWAVAHAPVATN